MKIAVAGTGYVGLVTAACFSEKGHAVTCVDIDADKVAMLKEGQTPIFEEGLGILLQKNADQLHYTTDYKNAYKNLVFHLFNFDYNNRDIKGATEKHLEQLENLAIEYYKRQENPN